MMLTEDQFLLTQAVLEILASHDIPSDYFVFPDFRTDCIIVHNMDLGFVISIMSVLENRHLEMFGPALEGLKKSTAEVRANPKLRALYSLHAQPEQLN